MAAVLSQLVRPYRPAVRRWRDRYFSEVGIVRREVNRLVNTLTNLSEVTERRSAAQGALRSLTPLQEQIVASLDREGFTRSDLGALGLDDRVLEYCQELAKPYLGLTLEQVMEQRRGRGKDYWVDMYRREDDSRDPIVDFALQPTLLQIIASYMGQVPVLRNIEYYYSPPYRGEAKASQLWHLDNDEKRRVKIFFNPFEMTEENGPTTAFPARLSTLDYYTTFPGYLGDEDALKAGLDPRDAQSFTGPPGTVHFADTSRCLHCGSRSAKARCILIIDYGSVTPYLQRRSAGMGSMRGVTASDNEAIARTFGLRR